MKIRLGKVKMLYEEYHILHGEELSNLNIIGLFVTVKKYI